jgi:hypothetical protein
MPKRLFDTRHSVAVSMGQEMYDRLNTVAGSMGVSRTSVVRFALSYFLGRHVLWHELDEAIGDEFMDPKLQTRTPGGEADGTAAT